MNRMTSRQRMLAAIRKQKPDRGPVAPDFCAMIPARLTGRGFYKVFIDEDPPLWRAYLDAVRHFGTDAWFTYGAVVLHTRDVEAHSRWIAGPGDHKIQEVTWQTPAGELTAQYLFTDHLPPRIVKR